MESFHWILPRRVAGAGRPGLFAPLDEDLRWLEKAGIVHVVSLTEEALNAPESTRLRFHHFPIPDMGIPTPRAAEALCRRVLAAVGRGEPVLLHCRAGLGRTGTMLACCLVSDGVPPRQAIERLRRISQHYIQSQAQERFVEHYAQHLATITGNSGQPWGASA